MGAGRVRYGRRARGGAALEVCFALREAGDRQALGEFQGRRRSLLFKVGLRVDFDRQGRVFRATRDQRAGNDDAVIAGLFGFSCRRRAIDWRLRTGFLRKSGEHAHKANEKRNARRAA